MEFEDIKEKKDKMAWKGKSKMHKIVIKNLDNIWKNTHI